MSSLNLNIPKRIKYMMNDIYFNLLSILLEKINVAPKVMIKIPRV